jgi:hypothetical protein
MKSITCVGFDVGTTIAEKLADRWLPMGAPGGVPIDNGEKPLFASGLGARNLA